MHAKIEVRGMRELRASLRQASADAPKGLRLAQNRAAEIVLNEARPRVPTRTGRARASLRARSTALYTRVAGGSARAPYYPWLDFGGKVGRGRSVSRPYRKSGRYIWYAYELRKRELGQALSKELAGVIEGAGLEVAGG